MSLQEEGVGFNNVDMGNCQFLEEVLLQVV